MIVTIDTPPERVERPKAKLQSETVREASGARIRVQALGVSSFVRGVDGPSTEVAVGVRMIESETPASVGGFLGLNPRLIRYIIANRFNGRRKCIGTAFLAS